MTAKGAPNKKSPNKSKDSGEKLVARNKKALSHFEIEEKVEAGLILVGSEVKSLRLGRGDLDGSFASIQNGEAYLHRMHIPAYEAATAFGHDTRRSRKLLLSKREIEKWDGRVESKGYTLVPLRVYFKEGWVKVEIGLGKGRKIHDDREKIKRETDRKETRELLQRTKTGRR